MDYRLDLLLILNVGVYLIDVYFILVDAVFVSFLLFHN